MIDLERLENALAELDDDVMMPSEVDGFVTGVLLCPEPIPPGEWLPIVWGGTDDVELVFGSREKADEVQGLVLQLYDHVAQALHNPSAACEPLLFEDERTDEVMWEMWIEGFEKALNLRPGLFETFYGAGAPEVAQTYRRLTELIEIARRESKLAPRKAEKLTLTAHAMIGRYVDTLNRARRFEAIAPLLANSGASPLAMPAGSVGRNDPCPCGSGRKYKKCCGMD